MSEIIKSEPIDVEEFTQTRSKRGRKRKTTDSENELKANYDKESNEYKKKRLRNNIAVRKSRDKGIGFFNFVFEITPVLYVKLENFNIWLISVLFKN